MSGWPRGRVMAGLLAGLERPARRELAFALASEIEALLGLDLKPSPLAAGDWPGMRAALAAALEERLDGPTAGMIAALVTDRDAPVAAFVEDLAEILFVPRTRRSEYRFNTLASRPWCIQRLLLEYATWSRRLDDHQTALSKAICARACDRLPTGCCSVLGYDLGLVPDRMLALQRLEAERAGWTLPDRELGCRYHTPRGCALRLFKSPACVGFMCQAIEDALLDRHGPPARAYLEQLDRFQRCDLDRVRIFERMAAAARAGHDLIGREPSQEAAWA